MAIVAKNDQRQVNFPLLWYYHVAQLSLFSLSIESVTHSYVFLYNYEVV